MLPAAIDLRTTLRDVKVPGFVVDRGGVVTWLNRSARDTFGDLSGRPFTSVVVPEDAEQVRTQLERKLAGTSVTDYEIEVFTADGSRQSVEISSVLIEPGDACHAVFGVVLPGPPAPLAHERVALTPRQGEVLRLLGDGASTAQIAETLHLSRETVRNHVRHVLRALGAHSRLEAVVLAHRAGLLD